MISKAPCKVSEEPRFPPRLRPMETAPRHGGYILLVRSFDEKVVRRRWCSYKWKDERDKNAGGDNVYKGWLPRLVTG